MQTHTSYSPTFSLAIFSRLNAIRCNEVFDCGDKDNGYWVRAMVEELGELSGATKKLDRGFNEREAMKMSDMIIEKHLSVPRPEELEAQWGDMQRQKMEHEAADLFIYLDLFCTKNNIDLWRAVKDKFNQVSIEMNCPKIKI